VLFLRAAQFDFERTLQDKNTLDVGLPPERLGSLPFLPRR
jgi:hypothetical protein